MKAGIMMLAAGGIVAVAAGCGGDSGSKATTTAATASVATTATRTAPLPPPKPLPKPKRIGQSVVKPATSGAGAAGTAPAKAGAAKARIRITVLGVLDPLPANAFTVKGLKGGQRYVAVRLSLKNVGRTPWADSPSALSTLISSRKQQAPKATGLLGGACNGFQDRVELAPGDEQRGCVGFILYRPSKPRLFQFSPDFPATPAAQWILVRQRRTPARAKRTKPTTTTSTTTTNATP